MAHRAQRSALLLDPEAINTKEETITVAKHFTWVHVATHVSRVAVVGSRTVFA